MTPTRSALYLFPSDIVDEGVETVRQRTESLGCYPAVAVSYHQARDVVPHPGRKPRLRYRRDGLFIDAGGTWPRPSLNPPVQDEVEVAAVAALRAVNDGPLDAWTVFLHNMTLGERNPDLVARTCFGDPLLSILCPSQPLVQEYARRLAGLVAASGFDVIAEALSAQTFAHGHHHERSFTPLGPGEQALLGVCFCTACHALGTAGGIDVDDLAERIRVHLQRAFAEQTQIPATLDALAEAVGGDVLTHIAAGAVAVGVLAGEVADEVRAHGRSLSYMDLTGAVLGYEDGQPSGAPAALQAWRLRVDPADVAPRVDSYSILGYVRDPTRLRDDVRSYRDLLGDAPLRVILRPGEPDTPTAAMLTEHVSAARAGGATQIDFYNYGMYDQSVLDRIPVAITPSAASAPEERRA